MPDARLLILMGAQRKNPGPGAEKVDLNLISVMQM
jgi:hypothetical protein